MSSSSKNFKFNIQTFQSKLNEEYLKISNLCFELANYFSDLITHNNNPTTHTQTQINKETPSHEPPKNEYIKKKRQRQLKSSKKSLTKAPLNSPSKKIIKHQGSGKVIKVDCIENGERVPGFQVEIKYHDLVFSLGPYKSLRFVSNLKNTLQEELSTLQCTQDNYKSIVVKCFEEIKQGLYKEFPVLELVKYQDNNSNKSSIKDKKTENETQ